MEIKNKPTFEEIEHIKSMLLSLDFYELAFEVAKGLEIDMKETVHYVFPILFLRKYTSELIGYVLEENVKQCLEIESLSLHDNQLTSVPVEIGNLSSLKSLSLYNNQLTSVPVEIGNLSSLEYLSLYNNQLTSVPVEIGNLSSLKSLSLDNNQLTSVPKELEKFL